MPVGNRCCWPDCSWSARPDCPLCDDHLECAGLLARKQREQRRLKTNPEQGTVYYLRVGHRIKIGWTADLEQRMRSYPPDSALWPLPVPTLASPRPTKPTVFDGTRRIDPHSRRSA